MTELRIIPVVNVEYQIEQVQCQFNNGALHDIPYNADYLDHLNETILSFSVEETRAKVFTIIINCKILLASSSTDQILRHYVVVE